MRKERFLIAVIAVMLGAAMIASLLTISLDIRNSMGQELRNYGANLIVLPGEGEHINGFEASHQSIIGSVPYLYFKAEINGKKIDLAGTDLEAANKMNPWWHIKGTLPTSTGVLAGINVAEKLGLNTGDILEIGKNTFRVSGILDTGTSYDDRIFMPMEIAEQVSGKSGATSIQVSVLGDIDNVVSYLEGENYRVKKIRQVVESERVLLGKTQLLMSLVALFVLSAACLSLMSTMVTGVLERSREIGLMKALGGTNARIASIFLAEACVIGAVGGVPGYFSGLALAKFIGMEIFSMSVSANPWVFAFTLITAMLIALIGSMLPIQRAISIDPVKILRGE